jgi:hypothetical protein
VKLYVAIWLTELLLAVIVKKVREGVDVIVAVNPVVTNSIKRLL